MASNTKTAKKQQTAAENKKLRAQNKRLQELVAKSTKEKKAAQGHLLRKIGMIFSIALAVALLFIGNLFFWAGNTLTKSDRYASTLTPVIQNTEVQTAIATYGTRQIFKNVDVEQYITDVLPPRADFIAPTITDQLQSQTQNVLQRILANPDFQNKWNSINKNAHQKFISTVSAHGADGVIDVNELYQQLSANLVNTPLSFLANKPLPDKVGSIQVASGENLKLLEKVINNIDTWRTIAIILFIVFSVAGIWLSRNRRRAVIRLGALASASMFLTLISIRVAREIIAGKVDSTYSEGVRQAVKIILHPLAIQTATILGLAVLVSFIAWVSGTSKGATALKDRVAHVSGGRLHTAILKNGENSLSLWLVGNKRYVQWGLVACAAFISLVIRLTPTVLVTSVLLLAIAILLVEVLSAPSSGKQKTKVFNTTNN